MRESQESTIRCYLELEGATERLAAILEEAMPVFQAAGDASALYLGYFALGLVAANHAQMDVALNGFERAFANAREAGLPDEQLLQRASCRLFGTTPVSELLEWLDEQEARGMRSEYGGGHRAHAMAMLGRFDEARTMLAETRAQLVDRGGRLMLAVITGHTSVDVELLADDAAAAVRFGEEGSRLLDELGERGAQSAVALKLAQALYALDRLEEADAWADRGAELSASDDIYAQMLSGQVGAKLLARRGEHTEAQRIAREAVAIGEKTDLLDAQGDAYADLAEVLILAGKPSEAASALEQALERHERKGNIVSGAPRAGATRRAQGRSAAISVSVGQRALISAGGVARSRRRRRMCRLPRDPRPGPVVDDVTCVVAGKHRVVRWPRVDQVAAVSAA